MREGCVPGILCGSEREDGAISIVVVDVVVKIDEWTSVAVYVTREVAKVVTVGCGPRTEEQTAKFTPAGLPARRSASRLATSASLNATFCSRRMSD